MNREEKLELKFLETFGWKKIKGFVVDHNLIQDEFEASYWTKENIKDLIKPCVFYLNNREEFDVFEDVNEAIDYTEDVLDVNFEDWKRSQGVKK